MKRLIFIILLLLGASAYAQDIITLRNGNEIRARITEISATEIRYLRFEHLDGPTRVIPRTDVFFINYEDGTREIITPLNEPSVATVTQTEVPVVQPEQSTPPTVEPQREERQPLTREERQEQRRQAQIARERQRINRIGMQELQAYETSRRLESERIEREERRVEREERRESDRIERQELRTQERTVRNVNDFSGYSLGALLGTDSWGTGITLGLNAMYSFNRYLGLSLALRHSWWNRDWWNTSGRNTFFGPVFNIHWWAGNNFYLFTNGGFGVLSGWWEESQSWYGGGRRPIRYDYFNLGVFGSTGLGFKPRHSPVSFRVGVEGTGGGGGGHNSLFINVNYYFNSRR
ncbi:MAG: hypothetical protein FWC94_04605 [Bacteroidales bacterium]|nr:hypothetical protein [Bacteroidales bacterium]